MRDRLVIQCIAETIGVQVDLEEATEFGLA
jgi:hypothetical protein